MASELDTLVRRYALNNAVEHNGKSNAKSILSKILGDNPNLRANVLQIKSLSEEISIKINKMTLATQKKELSSLGVIEKKIIQEKKGLPEMVRAVKGSFAVRFAPNPDGALHLGGARPAILNLEYAKKYNGKFILRFDDTDPSGTLKSPKKEFYKMIQDDLKWLGVKPKQIVIASKRLNLYYKHAEELIKKGGAYICTCDREKWKKMIDKNKACPCRDEKPVDVMKKWDKMKKFKFKQGEAVMRIKTDLEHRNPAVRDWPAFRIVDKVVHPFVKNKHLWPLYNFQSAIDDHTLGITHILRGQEHSTNAVKQQFLFEHFGWESPVVVILGRFSMTDSVLSKSTIAQGIIDGKYTGWDDLKVGTIKSLKRRGFQAEAITNMILDIGSKPSDITVSLENLAAYNRKLIDQDAKRYFYIKDPVEITIDNPLKRSAIIKSHPDNKKLGSRTLKVGKKIFIESEDFAKYRGMEIRLKDLFNIKLGKISKATSVENKSIPKIHWIPDKQYISVRVMEAKEIKEGIGEINIKKTKPGEIVQFERFGFVKIEKVQPKAVVAVFAHK
ncbi:glutamate--tRNA ligase [archaeon]|nr:glutamate--tRNA ligase [archaeon]